MGNIDYNHPLPTSALYKRYGPMFECLRKGLSVTITGWPLSSRSGFLKFILESEKYYLDKFIDSKKFIFIQSPDSGTSDFDFLKELTYKISKELGVLISENFDPFIVKVEIEKKLTTMTPTQKLVIFLPDFVKTLEGKSETIEFLSSLRKINKHNPEKSGVLFCFTASPKEAATSFLKFPFDLNEIVIENVVPFDLLNKEEILYTKKRLEYFRNKKISTKVHELASKLSAGHYILYKTLTGFTLNELEKLNKTYYHPFIYNILDAIWKGLSPSDQQKAKKSTSLFPPRKPLNLSDKTEILPLTGQEHQVFELLKNNLNNVITRDNIAQTIWKGSWHDNYSDWAIDKLISKLKSKLIYCNLRIVTLRNQGYKLTD